MPRTGSSDLLELLPPPTPRRHRGWFEQGRQPGYRLASMTPEQVEAHRADRRKLLDAWRSLNAPDAPFPFGAFEELKRQQDEAREALIELAASVQPGTGPAGANDADSSRQMEGRSRYAAAWRLYRRLGREARAAARYLRTTPPMTVPGLRWVFTEDDMRQVPEGSLPPKDSPEWGGYYTT